MAKITADQQDIITELRVRHGRETWLQIEHTDEPYGIVWIHWNHDILGSPTGRNLFVRPSGGRLSWDRHYE